MNLSPRVWITFFVLVILMGLNNVYSTLLTGWGDGGSIVAVILCLLFLPRVGAKITTYNLGQTIASSGGSVGFTVSILASIYYWHIANGQTWQPSLVQLSLLMVAVSVIGVLVAIPLRQHIVKWFFPGAVACATILRTVTSEDENARKRASRLMGTAGLVSALLTLPTKVAAKAGGHAIFSSIPLLPSRGLSLSVDPLLYGIGVVVGPRIGISMLAGSLFASFVLIPYLVPEGESAGEYIRWSAVGLMTLPAFASMAFALLFRVQRALPPGFEPDDADPGLTRRDWTVLGVVFVAALTLAIITMKSIFGVHWGYVVAGVAIGGPLCVALGKVASETDINPVRLLAIILLFVFSLFGTHSPVALLGMGVCGAALASIAVDLFYDLRTGYLVRANPKHQFAVQFMGVIPSAFVCVWFLNLLATKYGLGEGTQFPAPGAVVWATMADAFSAGATSLSSGVITALVVTSVVGVLLSLFEAWKVTRAFAPSAFAMGIALLLPFEMSAAICVGSLVRLVVQQIARRKGEAAEQQATDDAFQAGSAIFAASALTGIIAILLISFGIFHLPTDH